MGLPGIPTHIKNTLDPYPAETVPPLETTIPPGGPAKKNTTVGGRSDGGNQRKGGTASRKESRLEEDVKLKVYLVTWNNRAKLFCSFMLLA
ncbi:hypothetical protein GWI33_016940 [Rhynchophorus ferrugineus]|uniref:Uncharacterized protein n=1 Tax=Rhynchophorus ferrugineus TaxID=354439 RepID=A0A834I053_RHYFE|nr:hypothetical protein GWI33_016940 [Rhynchophorus ferrugineus]